MSRPIVLVIAFLICCAVLASASRNNVVAYGDLIPVFSGTSVTVYEQTESVDAYTFYVSDLSGPLAVFYTGADEFYNVSSDGAYLKIHCFRDNWLSGGAVGNNIVAVRLNGVAGYPEGLWASTIVNYTLGFGGTAESSFNALGADTQIGPYGNYLATLMGDQDSELVLGFGPPSVALLVKLTGAFDYVFEENVSIRIAALVKDARNMQPRSDANATIQIYYPDGTQWISDQMTERLTGTGIYEWQSDGTVSDLKLAVGVYVVHVKASVGDGPVMSDILSFHIDPPSEAAPFQSIGWMYYALMIMAVVAGTMIGVIILRRRREPQPRSMIRY